MIFATECRPLWMGDEFNRLLEGVRVTGIPLAPIDWLIEHGETEAAERFRVAVSASAGDDGIYRPTEKDFVAETFTLRQRGTYRPEGRFDNARRFFPSDREDCGGSGTGVRGPSRAWPFSYWKRCLTRAHCKNLVAAGLAGKDVPPGVVFTAGEWYYRRLVDARWAMMAEFQQSREKKADEIPV